MNTTLILLGVLVKKKLGLANSSEVANMSQRQFYIKEFELPVYELQQL